ncbi:MAG: FecR domain-containing protein [Polyangiaceae bacterium]
MGRNQGEARIGWRIPALLALVAASVVAVWWLGRVGDAPRIVATSALPTADIVGAEGAQWSERIDGETRRITVSVGEVSFRVDHVAPKARFVVELPDGDLEVHGTQFTVDVEGGRTRSVVVSEGVVELRVPGFHGRVYAHEAWRAPVASASATPSLSTTAAAPPSGAPSTSPAPPTSHDPSASPSATPPSAGERFAEAMGAFTSADYGRADHLFALFMQDFPRDSRAEDAMYLRAEARLRAGDASGAAAIARAYLGAFPKGFRRPEAERIAGLAPDSPPTPSAPPR